MLAAAACLAVLAACGSGGGTGAASAPATGRAATEKSLSSLGNGPQGALNGVSLDSPGFVAACQRLAATSKSFAGHTYVIGVDPTAPPSDYRDSADPGEILGFNPGVATASMDCLGWRFSFAAFSIDGLIPALSSGRADIQWRALVYSAARAKVVSYIVYFEVPDAVFVKSGSYADTGSLAVACGKSVGVVLGSNAAVTLPQLPCGGHPLNLKTFATVADLMAALTAGQVDLAVSSKTTPPAGVSIIYTAPSGSLAGLSVAKSRQSTLAPLLAAVQAVQRYGVQDALNRAYSISSYVQVPAVVKSS
jgi:ABC-type amino acid transport substrate-binding protein